MTSSESKFPGTLHPRRIVETAVYCDSVTITADFYQRCLALPPVLESERLIALDAGGGTLLLLFQRGQSVDGLTTAGGFVPGHDGQGPVHFAFAIDVTDVAGWEARLRAEGVAIESRVTWPRGGTSLYFRDPDGRSVELVTPGTWSVY